MLGCKRLNSLIVTFWNFQAFEQLCKDLADVHPAVLLSTVVFGTLGILYFFWSITVSTLAMYINPYSDCMKAATKFKVFCIRYFSKTKRKPAKKTTKQCISSKTKSTCQNSTTSEHFQKWPKNQGIVLALSLSVVILLRLCSRSRRNLFNYNQPFTHKSN